MSMMMLVTMSRPTMRTDVDGDDDHMSVVMFFASLVTTKML